ncbi:glycosyltransferase [Sulfuritalea sp.]|uniref:glycosyltransferase n=1 Tax=Sulfuritalea sp. TaxID=2480090 RepID=UPI001AC92ACE|nr:glycosyltransferase [Sulfuritalea sp.]MBN8475323.1 glycosyltransferase [Sulfuritalea sp.]
MKFALFTTNLAGGGAEKALAKIAAGLAGRGHEVDFIVCEDAGLYPPPAGCRFHALASRAGHGWLGKRRLAWRLARLLKSRGQDLLVSTLPFADEVAVLARAPRHVCRIANTLSAEIARLHAAKAERRAARYRRLYGRCRLVAVSQGVADDLLSQFGIGAGSVRVIGNPFDFAAIRAQAAEPCPSRPADPYILHVGRFAAQKRHDLLLAAFARAGLTQRLVLLTPPDPRLDALIAQADLQGRVVSADFQANPYPWMAGADLLVLCSDHEGLPNVLIEALACGTRVVSTDCPSGPREILGGELAQQLVPCADVDALAQAMRATLAAPKPAPATVAQALAPYAADRALDAWETLARESL